MEKGLINLGRGSELTLKNLTDTISETTGLLTRVISSTLITIYHPSNTEMELAFKLDGSVIRIGPFNSTDSYTHEIMNASLHDSINVYIAYIKTNDFCTFIPISSASEPSSLYNGILFGFFKSERVSDSEEKWYIISKSSGTSWALQIYYKNNSGYTEALYSGEYASVIEENTVLLPLFSPALGVRFTNAYIKIISDLNDTNSKFITVNDEQFFVLGKRTSTQISFAVRIT